MVDIMEKYKPCRTNMDIIEMIPLRSLAVDMKIHICAHPWKPVSHIKTPLGYNAINEKVDKNHEIFIEANL